MSSLATWALLQFEQFLDNTLQLFHEQIHEKIIHEWGFESSMNEDLNGIAIINAGIIIQQYPTHGYIYNIYIYI